MDLYPLWMRKLFATTANPSNYIMMIGTIVSNQYLGFYQAVPLLNDDGFSA
jgi:hypothetical protein